MEITISVAKCPVCGKSHDDLPAVKRDKPAEDGSTHEAECGGERFPVWHSGS